MVGYIIDDEVTIESIKNGSLNIGIYGYSHRHENSFVLTSVGDKLYYKFDIGLAGVFVESGYSTPDISDQKSILELSHLLRYKYDKILDTVFDNKPPHSDFLDYEGDMFYDRENDRLHLMRTSVKVDRSVINGNWMRKYVSQDNCKIIINKIIGTFINAKYTTTNSAKQ